VETTYIYGIQDLEIDKFIYVGKSNELLVRFNDHMRHSDNECVRAFVEERGRGSFQVEILETVEFEVPRDWIKREKFWKLKLEEEGHPLCNKNDGGGGVTKHTKETIAKMSGINNHNYGQPGYWYGKHRSEKFKAKQSKARSGKNNLMYGRTGEDSPHYGKPLSEARRLKIGKANAKPYPAFYNIKTKEFIPEGRNLMRMCREYELSYGVMYNLKRSVQEQSQEGWRLATPTEKGE